MKIKIGAFVVLAVLIGSFVAICSREAEFEARCVLAYSDREVQTNSTGNVIQPEPRMGAYVDFRHLAEENFALLLAGHGREQPFEKCCELKFGSLGMDSNLISKAVRSLSCKVSGCEIGVMHLTTRSSSKELAEKLLSYAVDSICQMVEEDENAREDKALAQVSSNIRRGRERGEDVSALERKRAVMRTELKKNQNRIVVLEKVSVDGR